MAVAGSFVCRAAQVEHVGRLPALWPAALLLGLQDCSLDGVFQLVEGLPYFFFRGRFHILELFEEFVHFTFPAQEPDAVLLCLFCGLEPDFSSFFQQVLYSFLQLHFNILFL